MIIENGVSTGYSEEEATKILSEEAVTAIADMKMGDASATAWGCDLTYDYIKINADYRSLCKSFVECFFVLDFGCDFVSVCKLRKPLGGASSKLRSPHAPPRTPSVGHAWLWHVELQSTKAD